MEELALMSGLAQIGLTGFAYWQMAGGFSFSLSGLTMNNHIFYLTLAHFFTGRAVLAFRRGKGTNGHAYSHVLALLALFMAYRSLEQTNNLSGMSGRFMKYLQGIYVMQFLASAALIYLPGVPRSVISQFIPLHKLGGTAVWALHSIQLLYTHYIHGGSGGNLGCWFTCTHLYEFAYHAAISCAALSSFAILYTITNRRVHIKTN
ncbi:unnamed protein product, partial [Mesorhabditis belari]|uniref:Cytochrome b561 domain-containing protein n=1 Tax=Mesorhabditis belari TaxID=2138241 RepID=A0AAF3FIC6_9BILA